MNTNTLNAASFSSRPGRRSASTTGQNRINTVLGWILVGIVCLAPLPFGSVRPFLWALTATLIGLCAIAYVALLAARRETPRISMSSIALPATLFAAFCLAILLQLVPFGSFAMVTADAIAFYTPQISIAPGQTAVTLLAYLSYGMLFWLMLQVGANDARRSLLLNAILVAIVAYAALGLFSLQMGDTILGLQKWAYAGIATGPFVNRNSFATFLAFGAVLSLSAMSSVVKRRAERHQDDGHVPHSTSILFLYGATYAFLLVTIIATQSRFGLLVTVLGSLVVAALAVRVSARMRLIGAIASVAFIVLLLALIIYGGSLVERLGSLDRDTEIRGDLYVQVMQLIGQRPLTGFGAGTFNAAFPLVHTPPVSPDLVWDRAHNSYLNLWSDMGLVAGSLPIVILGIFAVWLVRSVISGDGSLRSETTGLGILAVGAAHSFVDFSLEIHANALIFVAILGLSMSSILRNGQAQR